MYESFAYLKICANTQATYNSYDTCLFPSWVMWTLELNYKHIKRAELCMMSSSEDILWEHGNVNIIYSNLFFHVSQVVTGSSTVSSRENIFFSSRLYLYTYIFSTRYIWRERKEYIFFTIPYIFMTCLQWQGTQALAGSKIRVPCPPGACTYRKVDCYGSHVSPHKILLLNP